MKGDGLNPARGIVRGVALGTVLWLLIGLAIWGCTTRQQPSLECVRDAVTPWVLANYATASDHIVWPRPSIAYADQDTLKSGTGFGDGFLARGSYSVMLNHISVWDSFDMRVLDHQSTVVHEIAHWVDAMEGRSHVIHDLRAPRKEDPIFSLQDAWAAAHWPDGVC